jgi:hypothetical protein
MFFLSIRIIIYPTMCSWEYPAKQGIGCNLVSANDTADLLLFLQTLRAQTCAQEGAQNFILSAAVATTPFIGPDGTPVKDVSKFAEVLDYIGSPSLTLLFFHRCPTVLHRDHELRYLGILGYHRRT